jgi:hypothetical protein
LVSDKFKNKLQSVLLTVQVDKVEGASSTGDKKAALTGYYMIYQDPVSSEDAKKNAAYNIAVLFYELGDMVKTFEWANLAIKIMNKNDVLKFQDSFMNMAEEMFNYGEFRSAAILFSRIYNELCFSNSNNLNGAFRNAVAIALANDNDTLPIELISTVTRCKVDNNVILASKMDLLAVFKDKKRWVELDKMLPTMENDQNAVGLLIPYYFDLSNAYKDAGRNQEVDRILKKILQLYNGAAKKQLWPVESLDIVAALKLPQVESKFKDIDSITLAFPEETYNKLLSNKAKKIEELTAAVVDLIKIGSGRAMIRGYQYLVDAYQKFANEIANFTPPDKSAEYVNSFKSSMQSIALPLKQKASDYEQEARTAIIKSNILSLDGYTFLTRTKFPIRIEYTYPKGGIIMDRGGVR